LAVSSATRKYASRNEHVVQVKYTNPNDRKIVQLFKHLHMFEREKYDF